MSERPGEDFDRWLAEQLGRQKADDAAVPETSADDGPERETPGGDPGRLGDAGPPPPDSAGPSPLITPPEPPPSAPPADPWGAPTILPPSSPIPPVVSALGGFDWNPPSSPTPPPGSASFPFEPPSESAPVDDLATQAFDPFAHPDLAAFAAAARGSDPGVPVPTEPQDAWWSGSDEPTAPIGRDDALDDLFGESSFREYDDGRLIPVRAAVNDDLSETGGSGGRPPASGPGSTQKTLLWALGGILALIALGILFVLGTRLPSLLGPAPVISASPSPSPSPSIDAERPIGPVEPGVHRWDELLGGECLEPYTNPWVDEFTVVDCALPHSAQLVTRAAFPEELADSIVYPGEAALRAPLAVLCTHSDIIDYAAAGRYPDIQFDSSYPIDQEQWNDGPRDYFCFLSRSSGEPIEGTIAKPPAVPPADEQTTTE